MSYTLKNIRISFRKSDLRYCDDLSNCKCIKEMLLLKPYLEKF